MSVHTTIRLVTPNDDQVSAGPPASTARRILGCIPFGRTARAYAPGDPSPCHRDERLHADPYDPTAVFCPEDGALYPWALT